MARLMIDTFLLFLRFMGKYPEFPNPSENIEICLDAVAKELGEH